MSLSGQTTLSSSANGSFRAKSLNVYLRLLMVYFFCGLVYLVGYIVFANERAQQWIYFDAHTISGTDLRRYISILDSFQNILFYILLGLCTIYAVIDLGLLTKIERRPGYEGGF